MTINKQHENSIEKIIKYGFPTETENFINSQPSILSLLKENGLLKEKEEKEEK